MTEADYIAYFALLAEKHKSIQHSENSKSFFYIEDADELSEFDIALKNMTKEVAMLLVANNGEFNDNGSNNYTEELNGQLYILIRKRSDNNIRGINDNARKILVEILARVRTDKKYHFRLNNLPYQKVGPMNDEWYGYTAAIRFVCPFGFTVDNGTWLDK